MFLSFVDAMKAFNITFLLKCQPKNTTCVFFEKTAGVDGDEIREFIAICLPEENGNEITYKKCNLRRRLWADRKKEPAGKKCLGVENYAGCAGKKVV